jgi:hypothetical protein
MATANLILSIKITALIEVYFDTIKKWRPAPKQILSEIKSRNSKLHSYFVQLFSDHITFSRKVSVASRIVIAIFGDKDRL